MGSELSVLERFKSCRSWPCGYCFRCSDCAMSITLEVSLISGKTVLVQTAKDATVDDFKQSAHGLLSVGRAKLITSSGPVLDGSESVA